MALRDAHMILALPILSLNIVGVIVGAIWLAVTGQWSLLAIGILILLFGHYLIGLLLLPGGLLIVPTSMALEAGKRTLGMFLGSLALLWTFFLLGGSAVLVFAYMLDHRGTTSLFPVLLWAYGCATANWSYIASKEHRSDPGSFSGFSAFAQQIGCAAMMLVAWIADGRPTTMSLIWSVAIPLLIALALEIVMVAPTAFREFRYGRF